MTSYRNHTKARVFFLAPTRTGSWRIVTVVEHGPYHDERPASWSGPFATRHEAYSAAADALVRGIRPVRTPTVLEGRILRGLLGFFDRTVVELGGSAGVSQDTLRTYLPKLRVDGWVDSWSDENTDRWRLTERGGRALQDLDWAASCRVED